MTESFFISSEEQGNRTNRLYSELSFALSRTNNDSLRNWGVYSAKRLIKLAGRRIKGLSSLALSIGKASATEFRGLVQAWNEDRTGVHIGDRTSLAIDSSIAMARGGAKLVSGISSALIDDPKTNAPRVVAAFLGFYAGSGGVDGNGGIPDLDLLAGIDAHRSILTHSILAGVIAEGMLLAVADLASLVHGNLPVDHDPLWDKLANAASPLTESLAAGTSAGIAYHLLVDAGIQPAAYHGLPFEMPMEGHQTMMGANGLAETADVANRFKRNEPVEVVHNGTLEKTTGRKVVDTVSEAADQAGTFMKNIWRDYKDRSVNTGQSGNKSRSRKSHNPRSNYPDSDETNPAYGVYRPDMPESDS